MNKRTLTVSLLTAGLSAGLIAGAVSPAAAQGNPVGGSGSHYFLSGAGSTGGAAQKVISFGDANDETYFGDWDKSGTDSPMVRRGNQFFVANDEGKLQSNFAYGDAGDTVVIGDWDGDGKDSIAVQRGNRFFVKNDNTKTGTADSDFYFGDAGDTVLAGDWDGKGGDTLAVQRQNHFFVKNDTKTGVADFDFYFGDAGDKVLVGDWADPASMKSGNGADQLAVQRGNHFFLSEDLGADGKGGSKTLRDYFYGDNGDQVFVAALPTEGQIDKKRVATYDADVIGQFVGGETKFAWDGTPIADTQAGGTATQKQAAGDKQYFLTGEAQFYRGGEPVLAADGTHAKYSADAPGEQIHQASDIYISPEGAVVRHESGTWAGELMTWGEVAADDTNFPKIGALTDEWNLVDFAKGDLKHHRAGEPRGPRVAGEAMFYVTDPTGISTNLGPEAGEEILTKVKDEDYVLENGELVLDRASGAPLVYTGATKKAADKSKAGQPVVAREGQARMGYTFNSTAQMWTEIELDNSTKEKSDEAPNTYTAPSKSAPLVATLDADTTEEVGYYKGGEQLFYLSDKVSVGGTPAAAVSLPAYKGGELIVTHAKGDVKVDEKGQPVIVGTDKPVVITGDGLGVRRAF